VDNTSLDVDEPPVIVDIRALNVDGAGTSTNPSYHHI
jgi:hypothetical protein